MTRIESYRYQIRGKIAQIPSITTRKEARAQMAARLEISENTLNQKIAGLLSDRSPSSYLKRIELEAICEVLNSYMDEYSQVTVLGLLHPSIKEESFAFPPVIS